MGGISTSEDVDIHTHRAIHRIRSLDSNIAHISHQLMAILQIGFQIHHSTKRSIHWLLGNLEKIEVGITHICRQCGLQILGMSQCIQAHQSLEILVLAVHIGMYLAICHMSHSQDIIQLVLAIMHMVYLSLGL